MTSVVSKSQEHHQPLDINRLPLLFTFLHKIYLNPTISSFNSKAHKILNFSKLYPLITLQQGK